MNRLLSTRKWILICFCSGTLCVAIGIHVADAFVALPVFADKTGFVIFVRSASIQVGRMPTPWLDALRKEGRTWFSLPNVGIGKGSIYFGIVAPLPIIEAVLAGIVGCIVAVPDWKRLVRSREGKCTYCGYHLYPYGYGRCAECGTENLDHPIKATVLMRPSNILLRLTWFVVPFFLAAITFFVFGLSIDTLRRSQSPYAVEMEINPLAHRLAADEIAVLSLDQAFALVRIRPTDHNGVKGYDIQSSFWKDGARSIGIRADVQNSSFVPAPVPATSIIKIDGINIEWSEADESSSWLYLPEEGWKITIVKWDKLRAESL